MSRDGRASGEPPFVSVIVPVYDDAARLILCLEALHQQTYAPDRFEVVVIDNGSSEDIVGACRGFAQVRCVDEPRPGSYVARNTGVAASSGEVLAFTDADCLPQRDWLEQGVHRLERSPEGTIVGGSVPVFAKDPARPTSAELYESAFAFPQRRRIEEEHWGVTANLFVPSIVMAAVGPFDERARSGGDAEWCRRAHAAGYRIVYEEAARVDHPARSSVAELLRKARRVGGGARVARREVPTRDLLRYLARSALSCAKKSLRVLCGAPRDADGSRRFTLIQRLRIVAVLHLVTVRRLTEVVARRLTDRPASRR